MRDIFGFICLGVFFFSVVALVLAVIRPGVFSRRGAEMPPPAASPPYAPDAGPAGPSVAAPGAAPLAAPVAAPLAAPVAEPVAEPASYAPPVPDPAAVPAPTAEPLAAPELAVHPGPVRRSRPLIAILGGVAVVSAALTYVLLLMPVYSVEVVPPDQVVAAPGSVVPLDVTNDGALPGTFESEPTLDGTAIAAVSGDVAAGDTSLVEVVLPDDLAPGEHTLVVEDVEYPFTALTPPDYKVGKLKVTPKVVKPKQDVTVTVTVKNRGEAAGEFPGTLEVGGKEVGADETWIDGGGHQLVRVTFKPDKLGRAKLAMGEAKASLMVVKPVRPANGAILRNTLAGGSGKVVFKTGYPEDVMFCLTTAKKAKQAALVVYVRGKKSTTITGLRDGSYWIYYATGKDWNHYSHDFLTYPYHGRFDKPADFTTSSWTTSYIDWGAWTKWTTQHTRYTIFTIELSPKAKTKDWTPPVAPQDFPKL